MLKTFLLSVGLPIGGMVLVAVWKEVLKDKLEIEDHLAILELLVASIILMIAIWANDTDARSVRARSVAAVATVIVGIVVFPLVGRQVKRAYRSDLKPTFTVREARWANAVGAWVLSVCYFFTHLPS